MDKSRNAGQLLSDLNRVCGQIMEVPNTIFKLYDLYKLKRKSEFNFCKVYIFH